MPVINRKPWQSQDRSLSVHTGDAVQVMGSLRPASVDLAFADPPFNIGYKYDVYDDSKSKRDYLCWSRQWLTALYGLMKPNGTFWLSIGVALQAELKVLAEEVGFQWRDTVCWHYTFGPRQEKKYTPSWVPIHYFTVSKRWTWNAGAVRVPSARQLKYNDRRAVSGGKVPDNCWVLMPGDYEGCFVDGQNAFLESRVCGTFKERGGHPCQMPERVLERIVLSTSNVGDVVLDPFLGSGTTLAAAAKAGRIGIGIELSSQYARSAVERLQRIKP